MVRRPNYGVSEPVELIPIFADLGAPVYLVPTCS